MCGIFGYRSTEPIESNFYELMSHRGPDSKGLSKSLNWTLGHLRLSIIDTAASANQPFTRDKTTIVFNGEIYNFLELQKNYLSNCDFITHSDTEILLCLLNKFGLNILNELNGMFAFAYLDNKGQLYLIRDRFGVKPLYYSYIDSLFSFSSEIKPLLALQSSRNLDPDIIESFFNDTSTDFDDRSGYKNIHLLKSGHYIKVAEGTKQEQVKWYFGFNDSRAYGRSDQLIDECENILVDSIKLRLRADVPIALTLSGGIDSTLIYTLIKEKLKVDIQPFVFKHASNATDETPFAVKLAKEYGDVPIVIEQTKAPLCDLIDAMWHLELPMWSPSALSYFAMYREIADRGYKVVIEGHGSDEQMGGYPYMINSAAIESLQHRNFIDYLIRLKLFLDTSHSGLEQNISLIRLPKLILSHIKKAYFGKSINFNEVVNESFDYRILPIVLRTFDRLTMANSLESRMPFMDYRFVEFARKLPSALKVSQIGNKAILRKLLKKYGKKDIYLNKKKMGFASDVPALFSNIDFLNFVHKLVYDFDIPMFTKQKEIAISALQNPITWKNSGDVWKVASVSFFSKYNISLSKNSFY